MGRPSERLRSDDDTDADDIRRFAADLRELRYAAGNPTLEALAARTYVSKSVLSAALSGSRLPTPNTTDRLVRALGDDPGPWLRRRMRLEAGRRPPAPAGRASAPPPRPRRLRPRVATLSALTLAVLVIVLGAALGHAPNADVPSPAEHPTPRAATSLLPVVPDADPTQTLCREDAVLRGRETRLDGDVTVSLFSSPRCAAAWADVTRSGAATSDVLLTIEVYRAGDRYGTRGKPHTASGATSVRTGLLLGVTENTETCALASIRADGGVPLELGPPICG